MGEVGDPILCLGIEGAVCPDHQRMGVTGQPLPAAEPCINWPCDRPQRGNDQFCSDDCHEQFEAREFGEERGSRMDDDMGGFERRSAS